MSYSIVAYCAQHSADIVKTAKNKKSAMETHDAMAKTALHDLGVSKNSKATIIVMYKKDMIVRSAVSYGKDGKPFIETVHDPLNLKKKKAAKA